MTLIVTNAEKNNAPKHPLGVLSMYKTRGNGNVRNRKAYNSSLDNLKFDMIKVQNPRVAPTDIDCFMVRKGHMCIGEVKYLGCGLNEGQDILRLDVRKYYGAWYFFANATRGGLATLTLESDFIHATFDVDDGWFDYELYIVLSCYHQLMFLFANTFNYGKHPRLFNNGSVRVLSTGHFVAYCRLVCEEFARGKSIALPMYKRELYKNSDYRHIQDLFKIMSNQSEF